MSKWIRVDFKGKQIWAECGEDGAPVVRGGKVNIVYALGGKAYSTFADRLGVVAGAAPEEGPSAAPAAGGKSASKRGGGRSDSEVYGGREAEITNPASIHLWSDGACSGNPGPAGAGTVIIDGDRRTEMSTWLGSGTNNIAELVGILQGLRALTRPVDRPIVVHTDSQYGIGVLARGWKAKANAELIAEIKVEVRAMPRVIWHWVRGHEGVALNERCDALAREAIARRASSVTRSP